MKKIIQLGRPVHFRPTDTPTSACGIPMSYRVRELAWDPRDCECLRCIKTVVYKKAMKTSLDK